MQEIVNADIVNPNDHKLQYDGTRAIDGGEGKFREGISSGGKALKSRCFVDKNNSKKFPNLTNFINFSTLENCIIFKLYQQFLKTNQY